MRHGWTALFLLWPATGQGQQVSTPPSVSTAHPTRAEAGPVGPVAAAPFPEPAPVSPLLATPAGAFTASLVLPGAGQAALGLRRWMLYAALEATFWTVHLEAAADVRRLNRSYRDLAWEAARLPTGPATREDAGWSYYETLGHYTTSGSYDSDPQAAGVQPETDAATYNGMVWDLAQRIFLPGGTGPPGSPEYDRALAYYQERAAGPDFLWDWSGSPNALDRYRGLIQDADQEARVRSTALGLVLANHLVAAVDALVVARLRETTDIRLSSRLDPTRSAPRLIIELTIPIGN